MANPNGSPFSDSGINYPWRPEDLPEAIYPFEISEEEDEGYQSSLGDPEEWPFDTSDIEYDDDDETEDIAMGDTLGITPGHGRELVVTQPAIDDVDEDFFPNEEDMDDDHLSSHIFGHVHASSGIRRASRGAISHEVDWALIKVNENRRRETNVVIGGARHCELKEKQQVRKRSLSIDSASYPCHVVRAHELGGLRVHAFGRTSGLQTGAILPAMVMVKMPGRMSFSHSWQVMGNFGGTCLHYPF